MLWRVTDSAVRVWRQGKSRFGGWAVRIWWCVSHGCIWGEILHWHSLSHRSTSYWQPSLEIRSQSVYTDDNARPHRARAVVEVLQNEGRKEIFYLTTHSTHFIYGYMASDIWLRTILIVRKETQATLID